MTAALPPPYRLQQATRNTKTTDNHRTTGTITQNTPLDCHSDTGQLEIAFIFVDCSVWWMWFLPRVMWLCPNLIGRKGQRSQLRRSCYSYGRCYAPRRRRAHGRRQHLRSLAQFCRIPPNLTDFIASNYDEGTSHCS